MEKTLRVFSSFQEADRATIDYYRALTPIQRMDILLDLVRDAQPADEAERRLEKVYRIVELTQS